MAFRSLISIQELHNNLDKPDWVIIDCRFDLENTYLGRKKYEEAHIPGAIYTHLDNDLAGPIIPGKTSRHPLPDIDKFAETLSTWGIDESVQVVAYDGRGGAFAARIWWMLRWLGHEAVAVLDGSFSHWEDASFPTKSGAEVNPRRKFTPQVMSHLLVDADKVLAIRNDSKFRLVDSRSNERYHGIGETLDPVAGHIPGAVNAFYGDNITEDGHMFSKEIIRDRFDKILEGISPENVVFYCGSGVTAAYNILALHHAGLEGALLYPGSWSEWITNPDRPIDK